MPPRISVLVPTYNREKTIEECLRSALDAPFRDLEVLVSDNASTDRTVSIVERIAAEDPRVHITVQERNLGPIPNWKSLLARASGDLVHWLWSDDLVEPSFYDDLVGGMERHQAGVGVCAARVFTDDGRWTQIIGSLPGQVWTGTDYLRASLLGTNTNVSPCAALLPTESCRRHFYDTLPGPLGRECVRRAVGPDALMILGSVLDTKRVYVQGEPLVRFRYHEDSITVTEGRRTASLYGFARTWWSRRNALPLWWNALDVLNIVKGDQLAATLRLALREHAQGTRRRDNAKP